MQDFGFDLSKVRDHHPHLTGFSKVTKVCFEVVVNVMEKTKNLKRISLGIPKELTTEEWGEFLNQKVISK